MEMLKTKLKRKTSTPLLVSEEEGQDQLAHGAEVERDRQEREKKKSEHQEGPPEENPDQGHPSGEAEPRAGAPEQTDRQEGTSPMHTRAGTYLNKPAKGKKEKATR